MKIVRYYLNPDTGRIIKSNSKTFQELTSRRGYKSKPIKHKCFYNIKSAERCLNRLLSFYPGLIHPPSSFAKIPRTYKKGVYRSFIMEKDNVVGAVDKYGHIKKLQTPVKPNHKVPIIQDPFGAVPSVISNKPVIDNIEQKKVEEQLHLDTPLKSPEQINLIYNPAFDDFIPVNEKIDISTQLDIVNQVNNDLVPLRLPPITEQSNIAGLVKKDDTLIGVVTVDNELQRFPSPKPILSLEIADTLENKTETESDTASEPESDTNDIGTQTETASASESEIGTQTETASEPESDIGTQNTSDTASESDIGTQTASNETDTESEGDNLTQATESESTSENDTIDTEQDETFNKMDVVPILELDDKAISQAKELSPQEAEDIIGTINCLKGEKYDANSKRCLPCSFYGLEWNSDLKMCNLKLKLPPVLLSSNNKIVGYL